MSNVVYPPNHKQYSGKTFDIFLAGSIEMGTAEEWQEKITSHFEGYNKVTFYNPRRLDWDSSWEQTIDNVNFNEQVNWELDYVDKADVVVFYFDPNTKSPVTLLELGMISEKNTPAIVCCPKGFWRKGNVDIVCQRSGITVYETLDELIVSLKNCIDSIIK